MQDFVTVVNHQSQQGEMSDGEAGCWQIYSLTETETNLFTLVKLKPYYLGDSRVFHNIWICRGFSLRA